jgi:hypothetical protein
VLERWPRFEEWHELLADLPYYGSLSVLGEGLVGVELRVDEHFTLVVGRPVPVVSNAAGCLTSFRNDEAQS